MLSTCNGWPDKDYKMVKRLLLALVWLLASLALYGALVALEFYWNVPDWQPRFDAMAGGLLVWIAFLLLVIWALSQAKSNRLAQIASLIFCAALLVLAIYVFPPEPLKPGLLGRDSSSPLW